MAGLLLGMWPGLLETSLVYLLTALQGIVCGEAVYRAYLLKSTQATLAMLFLLNQRQVAVLGALLLVSIMPFFAGFAAYIFPFGEVVAIASIWCGLRVGDFIDVHDGDSILEDNNAHLGPGLAVNYWEGLIKPVLKGEVSIKMKDFKTDLRDKLQTKLGYCGSLANLGFRSFDSLVVLLPSSCQLKFRDKIHLHHVYQLDQFDSDLFESNPFYDLEFPTSPGKPSIKLRVHWIYANQEDEELHGKRSKTEKTLVEKILFIHDFPAILQSAMGPGRGWDGDEGLGLRKKNVTKFVETLKKLLKPSDYRCFKKDLVFCPFENSETALSDVLRQFIRKQEQKRERCNAVTSSEEDGDD